MRAVLAIACALLGSSGPAMALAAPGGTERLNASGEAVVGKPAPAFGGWSLDGRNVLSLDGALHPQAGNPPRAVVVSFFATWCVPCKARLKALAAEDTRARDQGLRVLLVAVGETGDEVTRFLSGLAVSLPAIGDKFESISERYGISEKREGQSSQASVPRTFVIDSAGTLRAILGSGEERFGDDLRAELERILDQR